MKKYLRHTLFLLLALCCGPGLLSSEAQSIFIPPEGVLYAHPGDSVGIFSDVINEGSFGSMPGSVVNFLGAKWSNTPTSLLPGTLSGASSGGQFRFMGKKKQVLAAGYNFNARSGPSFPDLSIENPAGVWLEDLNDLHVRGNLYFGKGYLYLNGWNTFVEDTISGYSDRGYVVTGGAIGGGSLYREPPSSGDSLVIFPLGTDAGSYSPVGITASQPFSGIVGATVFDHVYQDAVDGLLLDSNYVRKTWQVRSVQGYQQTKVLLQHQEGDEGIRFSSFRDSSYVSLYRREEGRWDLDTLAHNVRAPGLLTTGSLKNNTYLNDRIFPSGIPAAGLDSVSWLSVSTAAYSNITCPVADFKLWAAQRYNYKWVQLFWRTLQEFNIQSYEVQRRRDTSDTFKTIGTVQSKGNGGFSNRLRYYYYTDKDTYDGWSYYRLKLSSASGCMVYTDPQEVSWAVGIKVWPNPSPGQTHVQVLGLQHPIIMQLVDTWGQVLRQYAISNDGIYDLRKLADAVYFLVFRDPKKNNKKITTVKLVVLSNK